MAPGNPDLVAFIREKIRRDGPVTFAWFMEQALYHPEWGYYSSGRCQIGRHGDYFTNVSVGPLFGRMLAGQFAEMWEILGRPAEFTIVEQGAHHGDLASDVLTAARRDHPDFFDKVRYCLLEPFPILQARQAEALVEFAGKVSWQKSPADLDSFAGVHFSNELIDAMPVRLISRESGGEWKEKCVADSGESFVFIKQPIADESLREFVTKIPPIPGAIYETEVNLAISGWMENIARRLTCGFVVVVDYGYPRPEYYSPERNQGTLQAFSRHRIISSPLDAVGDVDITAHVDWTSAIEAGEAVGLKLIGFTDQHHFLTGLLTDRAPEETERRALQTLLHPEFLGTRFQYLALGKDVPSIQLSGFRFAGDGRARL